MSKRKTVSVNVDFLQTKIKEICRSYTVFCKIMGRPNQRTWVYDWGRNKNLPSPEEAAAMCGLLNIRPEDFLFTPEDIEIVQSIISADKTIFENGRQIKHCELCDFKYDPGYIDDVLAHNDRHEACLSAIAKYGFFWKYSLREGMKSDARNRSNRQDITSDEYEENQIIIFKALFSRSLEASSFSLEHPTFEEYASMLLNQKSWKDSIRSDAYNNLVKKYGISEGIEKGSYYKIMEKKEQPTQNGGLFDIDVAIKTKLAGLSKEEQKELNRYIDFIVSKRN